MTHEIITTYCNFGQQVVQIAEGVTVLNGLEVSENMKVSHSSKRNNRSFRNISKYAVKIIK